MQLASVCKYNLTLLRQLAQHNLADTIEMQGTQVINGVRHEANDILLLSTAYNI